MIVDGKKICNRRETLVTQLSSGHVAKAKAEQAVVVVVQTPQTSSLSCDELISALVFAWVQVWLTPCKSEQWVF